MEMHRVFPAEPTSAGRARRLTEEALAGWRYESLADVATLLVSELVTNALLHTGSEIGLRISLEGETVRVEVHDTSPVLPVARHYGDEAVTGRGLGLVEVLSARWGIESLASGKTVWFEVTGDVELHVAAERGLQAPRVDDAAAHVPDWSIAPRQVAVRLLATPVTLYRAMQQHSEALLREYTLMNLGSGSEGVAPSSASAYASVAGSAQTQIQAAADLGEASADLVLRVGPELREASADLLAALDEADALSRGGALLTPAALPEVRACRRWLLTQVMAQLDGAAPSPWGAASSAGHDEPARGQPLRAMHDTILDQLSDAVVVGDDGNHILHVNPAAERLLGWPRAELVGRRLTSIIPEHLREAHIAGFTRYLVTGEPRLLNQPVRVAARRRDGSEVPVELLLSAFRTSDGRRAFAGTFRGLADRSTGEGESLSPAAVAALGRLVPALAREPASLDQAAPFLLATIGGHYRCQFGGAWRVAPEDDRLTCFHTWDDGQRDYAGFREASRRQRFALGIGLPGRVWSTGRAAWIPDVVADANLPRAGTALEHGLRGAFALPVQADQQVLGVLEFFAARILEPDHHADVVIATIGAVVGSLLRPRP